MNFTRQASGRRSGRTLRMLLACASVVSEGRNVLLIGANGKQAEQLAQRLIAMLRLLGIPYEPSQICIQIGAS